MNGLRPVPAWLPAVGCLGLLAMLCLTCMMPFVLVDVMQAALERLNLSPPVAMLAVFGIFLGGLVNLPVYRIRREELQQVEPLGVLSIWALTPLLQRFRQDTVIAINVGGCLIPAAIAVWEIRTLTDAGGWPVTALALVAAANIAACYFTARPVSGVGIMMPGFVSPLISVGLTWLLLPSGDYDLVRAPVAFVSGVLGPLVGADLLHLKDLSRVSVGLLSIGGAGTFDGIVMSGILAAVLA